MIRGLVFLATFLCLLARASPCMAAEPLRLLVAVGHRYGLAGEAPLKHAARDATRVRDVFVSLGGVKAEHAVVLQEPTAAQLFAAIERSASFAKGRPKEDVSLVFYFSGHGDRDSIHLGGERVALRDLDARLATLGAALWISVADACRTADTRGKGVTADEPFAIVLDSGHDASGSVRVHASADGEIAQESDELGGAIFTHYWLSGLRGAADLDGDGKVTFDEAYSFAYSQTLFRSARASGVVQRPALDAKLREGAPIVLTRMATMSAIRFPRAADGHYIVYGVGSRTVAGELWSSAERSVALAVPPGKYIVHRRAGGHSAALSIDIGKNEQREIHSADLQAVPEEVLARKGGEVVLDPNELSVGYALHTARLYDVGHDLSIQYRRGWEGFALGVGALVGLGYRTTTAQESTVQRIGAEVVVELRERAGPLLLRAGGGPRVVAMLQTLRRTDGDRLVLAGYDPEQSFRATGLGVHALAGVRIPMGWAWADVDARGDVLGIPRAGTTIAAWSAAVSASLGFSF